MKISSIKNGNTFDVVYYLSLITDGGTEEIDFDSVSNLEVYLQADSLPMKVMQPYATEGNILTLSVRDALPRSNAYYRLALSFDYDGNHFMRNPIAFKIVENVEQEGCGCGCGCTGESEEENPEVQRVEVSETVGYERGRFGSVINLVDELPAAGVPGEYYAIAETEIVN